MLPFSPAGKIFIVGNSSVIGYNDILQKFGHTIAAWYPDLDAARAACTASRGDIILIGPGHAETLTTAADIALSVAGITVIGLGVGNLKPTFTFSSTDNAATMTVSGNNVRVEGIRIVTNDDALTNNLVVSGDNCYIDIEHVDTSSLIETATAVRLDTANNCILKIKHLGFTGGSGTTALVRLDDCDNVRIELDVFGLVAATGWVEMVDVASTNVYVQGKTFTQAITNGSRNVIDTITGSSWYMDIVDMSAGARYTGGSAAAVASDDISAIAANVASILTDTGTTLDAAITAIDDILDTEFPIVATAVGAVADAALADTIEGAAAATQSLLTDLKGVLQRIGADNANNTAATTLVAANRDGSVLERLEQLEATVIKSISKVQTTPSGGADALFTITGGSIHVVSIWGGVTTVLAGVANGTLRATTTTPASTTAMSTTVAIDNDAAGTSYTFVGPTGVLTPTTAGLVLIDMGSTTLTETQYIVPIGNINFLTSAAQTGAITWYMSYIPSPGATVVAA